MALGPPVVKGNNILQHVQNVLHSYSDDILSPMSLSTRGIVLVAPWEATYSFSI